MRAAEVAGDFFLRRSAFLVPDDHDLVRADPAEARDDRRVVAEASIAVQLAEIVAHHLDVVRCLRALWMPRHQHDVPRRQILVQLLKQALAIGLEAGQLVGVRRGVGSILQHLNLLVQLNDRLLERKRVRAAVSTCLGHRLATPVPSGPAPTGRQCRHRGAGGIVARTSADVLALDSVCNHARSD